MIDTDKYEGSKGRYFTGKMVDNYMNLQAEVKRLRELHDLVKQLVGAWDKTYHGREACDMAETLSSWMEMNE
tara:strand:- start:1129 stop:1344 length:216 start_codon:yes stop_codon:yes gene_type:complete